MGSKRNEDLNIGLGVGSSGISVPCYTPGSLRRTRRFLEELKGLNMFVFRPLVYTLIYNSHTLSPSSLYFNLVS